MIVVSSANAAAVLLFSDSGAACASAFVGLIGVPNTLKTSLHAEDVFQTARPVPSFSLFSSWHVCGKPQAQPDCEQHREEVGGGVRSAEPGGSSLSCHQSDGLDRD